VIQLVPTEIELAGLAERIRSIKAALVEANEVLRQADQAHREAAQNVRDLRDQFHAARAALLHAAGGNDEADLTW
jgi:hypothetical protein